MVELGGLIVVAEYQIGLHSDSFALAAQLIQVQAISFLVLLC